MLEITISDQIMIATLTHGKTNAITRQTLEQLSEAIKTSADDASIKGLIITGQNRFFSSGFDLPTFMNFRNRDEAVDFMSFTDTVLLEFFTCPKPVICAMNGHTAAGGLILAMASDYRIIADHPKIKIGMSEIKIGVPLTGAMSAVMRFGLDSNRRFRDVMCFGEMIDVTTARSRGMVDEIVDAEALMDRARAVVSLWVDNPGKAFAPIKLEQRLSTARRIEQRLRETDWHSTLDCFFDKQVKATLAAVQSKME